MIDPPANPSDPAGRPPLPGSSAERLVFERHGAIRIVGVLILLVLILVAALCSPEQRAEAFRDLAGHSLLGAFVTLACLLVVFVMVSNVEELTIDVPQRTYVLRQGTWPFCCVFRGCLDDMARIAVGSNGGDSPWGSHSWAQATVIWRDPQRRGFILWSEDTAGLDGTSEARLTHALATRAAELGARLRIPVVCEGPRPAAGQEDRS